MDLRVTLVSSDESLAGLCREVLCEVFGFEWTLEVRVPDGDVPFVNSLCIWDVAPASIRAVRSLSPAELCKHWFIVQQKDLAALHEVVGRTDINVLLKPATRASLRAFLRGAAEQRAAHDGGRAAHWDAMRGERDEMLQFLIQANLRLQEYDQERNNFLARSIHDFHSPLTAISGYCGLLLEEALGPVTQEQREILARMQRSATRLSRLSNAMFQLTIPHHAAHGGLELEQADLRDCVDQALHEVALLVREKRLCVTVDMEPQPEGLLFERTQIEQALLNLLDNACRFTPREGSIEIRGYPYLQEGRARRPEPVTGNHACAGAFDSFRIDIRDSGPGIPAADVHRIFEEYTSYSGGRDRSGAGLGLAICRMIVQRHRGRIWAESHSSGAVFSFVLPVPLQTGANTQETCPVGLGEN